MSYNSRAKLFKVFGDLNSVLWFKSFESSKGVVTLDLKESSIGFWFSLEDFYYVSFSLEFRGKTCSNLDKECVIVFKFVGFKCL